jgi:peptidoglycan/xylan/chitin deacetylase (PgdA/CDA1 family)
MQATVFLVAHQLGGRNEWDVKVGDVPEPLMTVEQIRASANTQFGSHTLDHADLSAVEPKEAWRQIADSKCALEEALDRPVRSFCYPYGRKTSQTEEMVAKAGYRLACSTVGGFNDPDTNRFALRRVNVRRDTSPTILLFKLLRDMRRA